MPFRALISAVRERQRLEAAGIVDGGLPLVHYSMLNGEISQKNKNCRDVRSFANFSHFAKKHKLFLFKEKNVFCVLEHLFPQSCRYLKNQSNERKRDARNVKAPALEFGRIRSRSISRPCECAPKMTYPKSLINLKKKKQKEEFIL